MIASKRTSSSAGLNPDQREPLDERTRSAVREHWQHVIEATGQPFDFGFFDRERFVYNTEPACRAVVTARTLEPGSEFRMLHALHVAFYAANRDVTDAAVLCDIAAGLGFDRDAFATCLDDPKTRLATGNDFMATQSLGIQGFPALLRRRRRARPDRSHRRLPGLRAARARDRAMARPRARTA